MVRTVDLFREYPTTLTTLFKTCFLSTGFEEEFLDRELQNELRSTPSLTAPRTTRPTITDWIFDSNQVIPSSSTHSKGLWTRMKFYKMKESQDESQVKLTSVTETQKYWIYDIVEHRYWTERDHDGALRMDDRHRIESQCLVLPQSSISAEPIFRIEVFMKMVPITLHRTKMEVTLKVECSVRAWGVSSWIERFLCDSAHKTYSNWLEYAAQRVDQQSIMPSSPSPQHQFNALGATNLDTFTPTIESTVDRDHDHNESGKGIETETKANSMKSTMSEKMSYGEMPSPPVRIARNGINGMNGAHHSDHRVHIVEMEGLQKRSSDECPEVHESRGIFKKEKVSCTLRMCRCVMRLCPSWFLSEKKSNIDLLVDTRCQCLEKTLWSIIVLCVLMIVSLAVHKYLNP